jgi:hypothetical protein
MTRAATGPETVLNGAVVSHAYTAPGTYQVRLKVTDNAGVAHEAETTVFVGSSGSVPGSLALDAENFLGPQEGDEPVPNLPESFTVLRGKWVALSAEGVPAQLTINVAPTGTFTGQLRLHRAAVAVRGRVAVDGTGAVTIPRKGAAPLRLQLAMDSETHRLRAAVHQDGLLAELDGHHALFTAATKPAAPWQQVPAEWLGKWKTEMASASAEGQGQWVVARNGTARFSGRLGKGTPFTVSGPLSREGRWPVYALLAPNRGVIAGWIHFPAADHLPEGAARWVHEGAEEEEVTILGER